MVEPLLFQADPMIDERLARLLRRFAAAAVAHATAMDEMDQDGAARHALVLQRLYREITVTGDAGRVGLLTLLDSSRKEIAAMAAVYSLRYSPERAAEVLRGLSLEEGLLGFRASMALERWEQGEWDLE